MKRISKRAYQIEAGFQHPATGVWTHVEYTPRTESLHVMVDDDAAEEYRDACDDDDVVAKTEAAIKATLTDLADNDRSLNLRHSGGEYIVWAIDFCTAERVVKAVARDQWEGWE